MEGKHIRPKMPYHVRLQGYESDKAKLSPKLDWWTREQAIKALQRKWNI